MKQNKILSVDAILRMTLRTVTEIHRLTLPKVSSVRAIRAEEVTGPDCQLMDTILHGALGWALQVMKVGSSKRVWPSLDGGSWTVKLAGDYLPECFARSCAEH